MAAAQVLAARIAGVDELAYHSLTDDAESAFPHCLRIAEAIPSGQSFDQVATILDDCVFSLGASDGN